MSTLNRDAWAARWRTPEHARLGVRAELIEDGAATFSVDLRYDDERADDPLFASAALTHAVDIAVLGVVTGHIDHGRQQASGTASLHVNYLQPLVGLLMVEARLVSWGDYEAVVVVDARNEAGGLILTSLSTYALRPMAPRGTA